MDLHHTSKLVFLNHDGKKIKAPLEWQPAYLEVLIPLENRREVQVYLQGQKLPLYLRELAGQDRVLADWKRSNPGYYRIQLEYQNDIEEKVITVLPQKISSEAFAQMLEDLDTRLPTSVAIGLQKAGALAGLKLPQLHEHTLAQEMVILCRAIKGTGNRPGLTKILSRLASEHHKILKTNEVWVRKEQVRKPSSSNLIHAFSKGHNLDKSGQPIRLLDTRVEHSVDVYENQLVKLFFELVSLRLRRVKNACEANDNHLLLDEVTTLTSELKKARHKALFFNKVSQLKYLPTQITMVLLKVPAYHAALEGYLEFIRSPAVYLDNPDVNAPLENLDKLYQIWGTLWVIVILLEVAEQTGYNIEEQRLVGKDKTGIFVRVFPNGQPVLVLTHPQHKTIVKLIPERTYGTSGELYSSSYTKRPDIALEIQLSDGSHFVYIFDPKYKFESENPDTISRESKPTRQDIDKMHAYSHAIRDRDGRQVVNYAAILYPGSYMPYPKAEIEALPAYPGNEAELRTHLHRILTQALNWRC
ncbi:hypothetical protein CLI64_08945 [Nostoc sp. CENA543]|uniref:DUF2357 domain-containing protein n=1 Tax=Nostoc sp. CENA543 TaxID=1869241 RepID=UPI000CA3CA23|nr:DUF2357 domain-containing protein [Nostoc sp. CENA543]AUT00505.1 hypothetical protein CLI64_08945 [Nostoc sp. CENA543]